MTNLEAIRQLSAEQLMEWLMTDYEQLKYSSIQTFGFMVDWFNKEARFCPHCNKLISHTGIRWEKHSFGLAEICPHCWGDINEDKQ